MEKGQLPSIRRYDQDQRIYLQFSPLSLARRRGEYTAVYDTLRRSLRSPACRAEDRVAIRQVLENNERQPSLGNLSLSLTISQWPSVSRAMRDWTDNSTHEYQILTRAWRRKTYAGIPSRV